MHAQFDDRRTELRFAPIPADMQAEAEQKRKELIEQLANVGTHGWTSTDD